MKVLFIISSRFGYTKKIADYIAREIKSYIVGCEIDFFDLQQTSDYELEKYELIIIGASIRYGHFHKKLRQLSDKYVSILNRKKTAFYSVNLLARKLAKSTPEGNGYTRKFLEKSQWKPDVVSVFAGELNYPKYSFFDKSAIFLIMKLTGGDTDTSKRVEYTNWSKVSEFTKIVLTIDK